MRALSESKFIMEEKGKLAHIDKLLGKGFTHEQGKYKNLSMYSRMQYELFGFLMLLSIFCTDNVDSLHLNT